MTTDEIDRVVHEALVEAGAYPSPLNYYNFPKSVCTSVNEVGVRAALKRARAGARLPRCLRALRLARLKGDGRKAALNHSSALHGISNNLRPRDTRNKHNTRANQIRSSATASPTRASCRTATSSTST